jgi:hypothetical protein
VLGDWTPKTNSDTRATLEPFGTRQLLFRDICRVLHLTGSTENGFKIDAFRGLNQHYFSRSKNLEKSQSDNTLGLIN